MRIEAAMLLSQLQSGPTMPIAAQRAFDSANAAYRAGKLPPVTGSRPRPRNSGGMPPANAPASFYERFMARKHPRRTVVATKRAAEPIPPAGARASDFEGWMRRNRPGLASDAADAGRSAHARRTIILGLKVVTQ